MAEAADHVPAVDPGRLEELVGDALDEVPGQQDRERHLQRGKRQDHGPVRVEEAERLSGGEQRGEQHHLRQREAGQQQPEVHLPAPDAQLPEAVRGKHGDDVDQDDHPGRDDHRVEEEAPQAGNGEDRRIVCPPVAGERALHHRDEGKQEGQDEQGDDHLQQDATPAGADLEHQRTTRFSPPRTCRMSAMTSASTSRMIERAAP